MEYVSDLTCTVCQGIFRKPVTVICGHTFCNSCAVAKLRRSPQCPLCSYPILGFQKLNTNLAIQAIVEKHWEAVGPAARKESEFIGNFDSKCAEEDPFLSGKSIEEIEILTKDPNIGTIGLGVEEVKCIGFPLLSPEPFRYFVGTSYELEISYHLSDELFKLLIPDHYFIGFLEDDKRDVSLEHPDVRETYHLDWAALFLIEKIVKFTISSVLVVARCKGHLQDVSASVLDFSSHNLVKRMVNDANDGVYLNYLAGREVVLKQPAEMSVSCQRRLNRIEYKMCTFINTLKETNEVIAEAFITRYGADSYGRKLSIDWNRDVHGFLNAVCSMLSLPPHSKRLVAEYPNYEFRVDVVHRFLESASFESDPIFFLNYENKNFLNHFFSHIGFLLALALFVVSVFYPKYSFWEFK